MRVARPELLGDIGGTTGTPEVARCTNGGAPGEPEAVDRDLEWVAVSAAAEKTGVSTGTVRQWYRAGRLPTRRRNGPGSAFLVPLEEVMRLAHGQRKADVGDDTLDDSIIDLDANYWASETEAARADAADARRFAANAQEQSDEAAVRADAAEAARDELASRLAVAEAERDDLVARLAALEAEHEAAAADRDAARSERDQAVAEVVARADSEARAVARARDLQKTLETMAQRLAAAEDAGALALERAEAAERLLHEAEQASAATKGLLEELRREAAALRQRLHETAAALDERRDRAAHLEEELRVLRSFASVTDHSWVASDVPGYKGPAREQAGPSQPTAQDTVLDGPDDQSATGRMVAGDAEAEAGEPLPEPFAIDALEGLDEGADAVERPSADRRRRLSFDFGQKADDLLPEDPGKRRRR